MATTRRTFLKTAVGLAGASALGFSPTKAKPRLAFSTWPLSKIVQTAVAERYEAVEIRGLEKEMYLLKRPEFSTAIAETRRLFADNNLKICNLGASSNLHNMDAAKRQENMDEAKRFIDLAAQLACPYIRVFPNDLPNDQDRQQTIDLISANLLELRHYAKGANVTVLLESHGKVVWKDVLLQILQKAEHPNVGLIWDIFNTSVDYQRATDRRISNAEKIHPSYAYQRRLHGGWQTRLHVCWQRRSTPKRSHRRAQSRWVFGVL